MDLSLNFICSIATVTSTSASTSTPASIYTSFLQFSSPFSSQLLSSSFKCRERLLSLSFVSRKTTIGTIRTSAQSIRIINMNQQQHNQNQKQKQHHHQQQHQCRQQEKQQQCRHQRRQESSSCFMGNNNDNTHKNDDDCVDRIDATTSYCNGDDGSCDNEDNSCIGSEKEAAVASVNSIKATPPPTLLPSGGKFATSTIQIKNSFTSITESITETTSSSTSSLSSSMDLTDRFKYKMNALLGLYDPITDNGGTTSPEDDTERDGTGNILNALLQFPIRYKFNVVGKVSSLSPLFTTSKNNDSTSSTNTTTSSTVDETAGCDNSDNNSNDNDGNPNTNKTNNNKNNNSTETVLREPLNRYITDVKDIIYNVTGDDEMVILTIQPRGTKYTKITIEALVYNSNMITTIYNQLQALEVSVMQF